ncbi:MAG: 2-succinyl-5-enolpyruvyl-6-hydroxy-3-cyclohexene-1-carboxylic-acid synthase [Chloroflexi bacterium TMED70]|nr:MAG: 2-succinyl-5-enolpyruvyl-6-hydroxy-3-cyclohexene-1-carboxylic-acid synthase [Chloroflexi bacterium TMED70]
MLHHDKQIKLFLEQLISKGIKNVVISPGSRSTPLVNNFLNNKDFFNIDLVLDERSAAYFALGKAKKTNSPTILICTSGTATLNYSPAISEAYYSKIPMIVITSDRPMHFRETGANQTLNQTNLYQNNINWFYDIPLQTDLNIISNIAFKAINFSNNSPKGPVHINWQFNEPFTDGNIEKINQTQSNEKIIISEINNEKLSYFIEISNNKRGIILVGDHNENLDEISELSRNLNWPIIADPLSNLRDSKYYKNNTIIDTGDFLFRSSNPEIIPEVVIHIGSLPVSKFISKKIENAKNHIFIEDSNRLAEGFSKIDLHLKLRLSNLNTFLTKNKNNIIKVDDKWKKTLKNFNDILRYKIDEFIGNFKELSLKKTILENIPINSNYISGNSLPVRHLDIIMNKSNKINFVGNRGLSGIDGNISIATGYSNASENHTFLDIGDLSFFHDVSSLITAVRHGSKLTILVNNNKGGQIFNLLPQKKNMKKIYDEWFITSHSDFSIENISKSFGCEYHYANNDSELKNIILENLSKNKVDIIELDISKSDYEDFNIEINKIITDFENNND